jgi:hypothetical protein
MHDEKIETILAFQNLVACMIHNKISAMMKKVTPLLHIIISQSPLLLFNF